MTLVSSVLLSLALTAITITVLGNKLVQFEDSDVQTQTDQSTAVVAKSEQGSVATDDGERSSNLSYVMAVKNSSIWTDVRTRVLTIEDTPSRLAEIVDEPPEELSDEQLAVLRRACHDGLKCVAVDRLLVFKSASTESTESTGGRASSVRMAITKITKVLTDYTTEYHEDAYRYEEVTESDDESKVRKSVTAIVEDNRELCQIKDADASATLSGSGDESSGSERGAEDSVVGQDAKNAAGQDDGEGAAGQDDGEGAADQDGPITNVNYGSQNYGTINNYNINYGTVNSTDVNSGGGCGCDICMSPDAPEKATPAAADGSVPSDANPAADPRGKRDEAATVTIKDTTSDTADAEQNGSRADMAVAGPQNTVEVRKGSAEDGTVNNGNMLTYNINKGTINKGVFNDCETKDGGILSVGNVNNGPVNYGRVESAINDGTVERYDGFNLQQFATDASDMYADVLSGFARNGIKTAA